MRHGRTRTQEAEPDRAQGGQAAGAARDEGPNARALGFAPHSDYAFARPLLADVDTEACETVFEFGEGGKPLYVAGPNDSTAKVNRIMNTLTARVGHDGFRFIVPGGVEEAFAT